MMNTQVLDANESIFFERELENIKSQSKDILFPNLKIAEGLIIPISREASSADTTITYRQFDQAGIAMVVANYADDFPSAEISGKEFTSVIQSLGASFNYNIQEIRAAQQVGRPLQQRKADAARRSIMQKVEAIGFKGDADSGLKGFINNPNIQEFTLPADGTGGSTKLSTKTPDQILRDLNGMATQVSSVTKGVESPNIMLVPLDVWNDLMTRRIPDTNITVMQFFLQQSPHIQRVDWLNQLTNANEAGTEDVIMMYDRSPEKLTLEIPVEFEQFAPQEVNMAFKVNVHSRIGGVIIYYPLSVIKAEGA